MGGHTEDTDGDIAASALQAQFLEVRLAEVPGAEEDLGGVLDTRHDLRGLVGDWDQRGGELIDALGAYFFRVKLAVGLGEGVDCSYLAQGTDWGI